MKYNNDTGDTPTPSRVGLVQLFNQYLKIASRDIHTQTPAKVLEVDYDKGFVTVQPLLKTVIDIGKEEEVELLPIDEVPIMMISSKRGKSRLSTPVSVGDVGILFFSERDTGNYLNSEGDKLVNSGEYAGVGFEGQLPPIGFFPEIFTASANRKIRSDATVLEDGKASVALKESGEVTVKNDNVTIKANPDGSNSITNSGGTFSMAADGTVNINGFIINPDGSVVFPSTITGPTVAAQTSLTVNGQEMDQHAHSDGTYAAGTEDVTGNSGAPI